MVRPVDVIVIAQDEAANIEGCLESVLGWANKVFVVDGGSRDRTVALARNRGATVVEHPFQHWADQRNWALATLPLETAWVLFLDADEELPAAARRQIEDIALQALPDLAGVYVRFTFYFLGRALTHAYESPPVMRLVRRGRVAWVAAGAREYCRLDGRTLELEERIIHRDRKSLHSWVEKQNRNASREAELILSRSRGEQRGLPRSTELERPIRTWVRERVYQTIPGPIRPLIHFGYRYFLRLGLLDGFPGFVYCALQSFCLPLLAEAKVYEAGLPREGQVAGVTRNLRGSAS